MDPKGVLASTRRSEGALAAILLASSVLSSGRNSRILITVSATSK